MNYAFMFLAFVVGALPTGLALFWIGHEHGVRSAYRYKPVTAREEPITGNVRLILQSDRDAS